MHELLRLITKILRPVDHHQILSSTRITYSIVVLISIEATGWEQKVDDEQNNYWMGDGWGINCANKFFHSKCNTSSNTTTYSLWLFEGAGKKREQNE